MLDWAAALHAGRRAASRPSPGIADFFGARCEPCRPAGRLTTGVPACRTWSRHKVESSRRVLVTGASGFIGANLVRTLLRDGHETHALVRAPASAWRLAGLNALHLHPVDLRDGPGLKAVVRTVAPEIIFHAAAHGTMPGQTDRHEVLFLQPAGHGQPARRPGGGCRFSAWSTWAVRRNTADLDRPMRARRRAPAADGLRGGQGGGDPAVPGGGVRAARSATGPRLLRLRSLGRPDAHRLARRAVAWPERRRRSRPAQQPRDFIFVDDVVDLLLVAASHAGTTGPDPARRDRPPPDGASTWSKRCCGPAGAPSQPTTGPVPAGRRARGVGREHRRNDCPHGLAAANMALDGGRGGSASWSRRRTPSDDIGCGMNTRPGSVSGTETGREGCHATI